MSYRSWRRGRSRQSVGIWIKKMEDGTRAILHLQFSILNFQSRSARPGAGANHLSDGSVGIHEIDRRINPVVDADAGDAALVDVNLADQRGVEVLVREEIIAQLDHLAAAVFGND